MRQQPRRRGGGEGGARREGAGEGQWRMPAGGAGGPVHHALPRRAGAAIALAAARRAHGHRRDPDPLALSPCADGRAHDRLKVGTGGSSGHDYLRRTAERHRISATSSGSRPISSRARRSRPCRPMSRRRWGSPMSAPGRTTMAAALGHDQADANDPARPDPARPGRRSPASTSARISAFREAAPARMHLAAHSHHYWPDVTRAAQAAAGPMPRASPTANGTWCFPP